MSVKQAQVQKCQEILRKYAGAVEAVNGMANVLSPASSLGGLGIMAYNYDRDKDSNKSILKTLLWGMLGQAGGAALGGVVGGLAGGGVGNLVSRRAFKKLNPGVAVPGIAQRIESELMSVKPETVFGHVPITGGAMLGALGGGAGGGLLGAHLATRPSEATEKSAMVARTAPKPAVPGSMAAPAMRAPAPALPGAAPMPTAKTGPASGVKPPKPPKQPATKQAGFLNSTSAKAWDAAKAGLEHGASTTGSLAAALGIPALVGAGSSMISTDNTKKMKVEGYNEDGSSMTVQGEPRPLTESVTLRRLLAGAFFGLLGAGVGGVAGAALGGGLGGGYGAGKVLARKALGKLPGAGFTDVAQQVGAQARASGRVGMNLGGNAGVLVGAGAGGTLGSTAMDSAEQAEKKQEKKNQKSEGKKNENKKSENKKTTEKSASALRRVIYNRLASV